MPHSSSVVTIRPRRPAPILVCKKCLSRIDDGKKFKRALKSDVKRDSKTRGTKRPRIVLTGCFGICPKRSVVMANASMLQHGEYLLADSDNILEAAAILLHPDRAKENGNVD